MERFMYQIVVAAVVAVAVVLIASPASAQLFPPGPGPTQTPSGATAITSGPGDKGFPAISGNTIAWIDNTTMSVQVYDVVSGQTTTIPGNNTYAVMSSRQVDVSGNYVVWTGMSAETMASDIYLYDVTQGSVAPITGDQAQDLSPSISGNIICWNEIDMTTGKGTVYVFDLASRQGSALVGVNASSGSAPNQLFPAVGGDIIAFFNDGGNVTGHLELTWLSLSSGDTITFESTSNPASPPAVSSDGRWIVWVAEMNGAPLLFMADTVAPDIGRITETGALPTAPAVDGNYVVWTDYRNGNGDIYLFDTQNEQEKQITSDSAEQAFPDISDGRIVWMGYDTGQWEIYTMEVTGSPGPITPGPITPGPITPGPVTPGPVTPGPVTPGPVTPGPITPGPVTPGPITPGPVTPGPVTPSTGGLTITPDDIANLQWQEDPVMPGWLTAKDPARGLTFIRDPNTPDIILIQTTSGEWYGYSVSTGMLIQVQM